LLFFMLPGVFQTWGISVGGPDWFVPAIAAGVWVGLETLIWPERSCPICKSKSLTAQRPAAHRRIA
jgi:hypothetical protein